MKNVKSSTAAALLSLSIGLSGIIISIPTSSLNTDNNVAHIYTYINDLQNKNRYISRNNNITMNSDARIILTQKNLLELKSCINDEPAAFGEDIYYWDFFNSLRKQDNYEDLIKEWVTLPIRYQLSFAVLLSQVNRNEVSNLEKSFIINLLNKDALSCQEYALNTISLWNDEKLLPYIENVNLNNFLLQRRLEKIINRFKKVI